MSKKSKSTAETPRKSRTGKTPPPRGRTSSAAALDSSARKHGPKKSGPGSGPERPERDAADFVFYSNPMLTLVCIPADMPVRFSLEDAADLTGVHPDMLRYYWRAGLIEIQRGDLETELFLDETALHQIRRIEHYRRHLGVSRRALPLICELQRESARQRIELHFLRYP